MISAVLRGFILAAGLGAIDPTIAAVQANLGLNPLGRYMSPSGACKPVTFPGWIGYSTKQCTYKAASRVRLDVILLNPDARQLASWYVTACRDAHARYVIQCAERIDLVTTCQSGAQFPVAGYVDEGKIYTFRDGVTVRMSGLPSTTVPKSLVSRDEHLVFNGAPAEAKRYARISSTTRSEFARFVGKPAAAFAGLRWLLTVRREYQAAWSSERNALISARVAADVSEFDQPRFRTDFDTRCGNIAGWKKWPT